MHGPVSPASPTTQPTDRHRRWHGMLRTTLTGIAGLTLVAGLNGGLAPAALAAPPAGDSSQADTLGQRSGATRLPVPVSDRVQASVDVGTGNLMIQIRALDLRGINQDTSVGLTHNSLAPSSTSGSLPARWNLAITGAGHLTTDGARINFVAADGSVSVFTPVTGSSTTYTPPPGMKADLVKNPDGYTLTWRTTATVVTFDSDGNATKVTDRNNNTTTIGHDDSRPINVVATKGASGARRATIGYDSAGKLSGFSQTNGYDTRTIGVETTPYGDLSKVIDAEGKGTFFTYAGHRVTSITSPGQSTTDFAYDSAGRVTKITRANTNAGTQDSVTRLAYPTGSQTLLAGPNTSQSAAVSAVAHTTYTLTSTKRVSKVVDAAGREQSKTYTADFDTLSSTRGTGTGAGTTSNTFGANNGQSQTASQGPGGASSSLDYANTAANTSYLPTSGTDDAGNTSLYTYNGSGNALSSQDALAATANLTYNSDGTVATATAPGNGSNKSIYTYNSNKELTKVTPVTGSSLGNRSFTYDIWGRAKTATNGAGTTATYTYDANDRVLSTTHSDGKANTAFTYTPDGQVATRTDANGSTTYGYDDLGRLVSRVNTAGGGTIAYGYDLASNLVATTDTRGTTSYAFDASGVMTTLTYQYGGTRTLAVATDAQGRRTDTWLQASTDHTRWKAHNHTTYDTTGRITRVTSRAGEGDHDNTIVMDLAYCYTANTTPGNCTTSTSNDRNKVQWTKDNVSGATTSYTYDAAGRIKQAKTTGGDAPKTYDYTYDTRGNRLTATTKNAAGTTTSSQALAFNAANQVTTTGYTYDGAGNLTADPQGTYAYNGAGQMVESAKGASTYVRSYAGTSQDEVLTQQSPGGTYAYTYGRTDAQGLSVIEQVKHESLTAYIEHDPVTGEPLMLRTSSGMQSLYVQDGLGNPVALVTSAPYTAFAYEYDPYGTATLTENSGGNGVPQNPYTFKNGTQDRATGWIKYGARWYNPTTGRWTQQDTLDAPLDPANANRYAYAANDPINLADALGLAAADTCASDQIVSSAASGAVGGAVGGLTAGLTGGFLVGGPVGSAAVGIGGAVAGGVVGGTLGALQGAVTGNIGCRVPGAQWVLDL